VKTYKQSIIYTNDDDNDYCYYYYYYHYYLQALHDYQEVRRFVRIQRPSAIVPPDRRDFWEIGRHGI
jgi:hypothetical protein